MKLRGCNSQHSYYKSVNIITQSPPPHSVSSHSSESLSSVTPRISTNPFLCAPLTPPTPPTPPPLASADNELDAADEQQQQQQQPAEHFDESVPSSAYPASFYYQTGDSSRRGHSHTDMPRKRSNLLPTARQQQQHVLLNGNASNGSGNNSQNPFIKENYWETTPRASALLHSPTEYPDEQQQQQQQQQQQHLQASARRAFHQQREQHYRIAQRPPAHAPPHVLRVGRSPINRNYAAPQQQQQPTLIASNACAEGLTPLASHYLYGSKTSLEQQPSDWEPREQRKQRIREERERERDREHLLMQQQQLQLQDVHAVRENQLGQLTAAAASAAQQQQQQQRKRYINLDEYRERDQRLVNGSPSETTMAIYEANDATESWQHLRVTTEQQQQQQQQQLNIDKPQSQLLLDTHTRRLLDEAAVYREHKLDAWQLDRNYTLAVESRHGIIANLTELRAAAATPPPPPSPQLPAAVAAATITTAATAAAAATTATAAACVAGSSSAGNGGQAMAMPLSLHTKSSTFDYLYEFSETRKVLEEFFKCPSNDEQPIMENGSDVDSIDIQYEFHSNFERDEEELDEEEQEEEEEEDEAAEEDDEHDEVDDEDEHIELEYRQQQQQPAPAAAAAATSSSSVERHVYGAYAQSQSQSQAQSQAQSQPRARHYAGSPLMRDFDFFLDSASRSSGERDGEQDGLNHNQLLSTGSGGSALGQSVGIGLPGGHNNYRYSPETTDYDSNCGDLDSLSGEMNGGNGGGNAGGVSSGGGGGVSTSCSNYAKYYASAMPVLEDGLSSGHTSDTENNNNNNKLLQQSQLPASLSGSTSIGGSGGISMLMDMKRISTNNSLNSMHNLTATSNTTDSNVAHLHTHPSPSSNGLQQQQQQPQQQQQQPQQQRELLGQSPTNNSNSNSNSKVFKNIDPELDSLYSISVFHRPDMVQMTPPPPAPAPHRKPNDLDLLQTVTQLAKHTPLAAAISNTLQRSSPTGLGMSMGMNMGMGVGAGILGKPRSAGSNCSSNGLNGPPPPIPERSNLPSQQQQQQQQQRSPSPVMSSPVWLSRHLDGSGGGGAGKALLESSSDNHSKNHSADEEDVDTDLETDRLLGHQRLDDQGYYDENKSWERKPRSSLLSKISPKQQQLPSTKTRNGYNALLSSTPELPPPIPPKSNANSLSGSGKLLDLVAGNAQRCNSRSSSEHSHKSPRGKSPNAALHEAVANAVDVVVNAVANAAALQPPLNSPVQADGSERGAVLIEGVLFRAKYLGSTQLVCEGQPTKSTRMMQAEEAVSRIKAPDGDVQPSTEVDLFISTEKIMVLNTDLKEIMMDHALRTISYIADIGDLVVLMARRRFVPQDIDDAPKPNRTPKMICHVFESDEAQFIAQSIGQAFQVAYMEFLKANGIEDHRFVKEMDYQEVLNSQEIFGDELEIFAKKELQKEVVVPKAKGEILGVVIVESGWGSMLPTVVIANLMSSGAAARCGQLNIGDQLIAINGLSLVGLPLSTCQTYIKNTKNQTVVKFTVVPCAPVVEVKIKRPETKYQLGFSVQNGVICSLLRGGIAERGGVRVGHRIIEINNQSVVAVPHEKIVNLLATSVGEILMKTMPTSMFRLLTGQENPIYI
ncbi:X11Lbeta [Drosophila busckii]|uniref:X11Lbeta n=1 Tax=Drosophila busckii TaxID=30019 RepID=A0A0M3QZH1_DROBS|nr:X11Lbeta [Drosophila busckii]